MKIYSDGFTIGKNPSNIGGGYVVMNEKQELLAMEEFRKLYFTNNEAELKGLCKAAELARDEDTLVTDSMTAYYWVKGGKCKARPDLSPFAKIAQKLIVDKTLNLVQEPRETNVAGNYIEFVLQK